MNYSGKLASYIAVSCGLYYDVAYQDLSRGPEIKSPGKQLAGTLL